jgi:hypothetical protein
MKTARREFLLGIVAGSMALGHGWTGGARPLEATEVAALDAARRDAGRIRRRVIFNNDGDDIWAEGADTREKFLASRHTPLLGTNVDSIFYCTTQSFNHFTHDTRVAEMFTAREGQFANNQLARFIDEKTDGLRMSTEFALANGLETIWTLRMNDIHDAWTPAFLSKWKQQDPTRVMSTLEEAKQYNDRRRLWSLVDFEHPDVEPRMLEIIEEVLVNYDVDGIELDFLRAPCYFRTTYEGKPATGKQADVLTHLVSKIRSLVRKQGELQGKPFLLAARVPSTPALCRYVGIDIGAWLVDKQLDLLVAGGGYITFDLPLGELVSLASKHDVPIYPAISQSGLMYRSPRGTGAKQPPEAWYGTASRHLAQGADGIYTFNLFPGPGSEEDRTYARTILGKLGSPEKLHDSDIMYGISDAGFWMPSHYWAKDAADFSKALPLVLKANEFERTSLEVPEDLSGVGFDVTAELRVDFTGLDEDDQPEILFGSANFGPTPGGQKVAGVRRYLCTVPVQAIKQGANRVMVKTKKDGVNLVGAELWIRR